MSDLLELVRRGTAPAKESPASPANLRRAATHPMHPTGRKLPYIIRNGSLIQEIAPVPIPAAPVLTTKALPGRYPIPAFKHFKAQKEWAQHLAPYSDDFLPLFAPLFNMDKTADYEVWTAFYKVLYEPHTTLKEHPERERDLLLKAYTVYGPPSDKIVTWRDTASHMPAFASRMVTRLAQELHESIQARTIGPIETSRIRQVLQKIAFPAGTPDAWDIRDPNSTQYKIAQKLLLIRKLEAQILDEVATGKTSPADLKHNATVHEWQQGFETLWGLLEEAARLLEKAAGIKRGD
jgi:hypothetical protein